MRLAGIIAWIAGAWGTHYFTVARFWELTPLMVAAQAGDAAAVERELRAGADPNRVWNENVFFRVHGSDRTGVTPLLFALETGGPGSWSRAPVVKPLLAAGADPCAADSHRGPALLRAVENRDLEVVRALWEHDREGCLRALSGRAVRSSYFALGTGPEDPDTWALVEFLLDHVAQPGEADHPGPLISSQQPAATAALERLLARGVKADGESLFLASHRKAELIPWLVEHGADVNAPIAGSRDEDFGPPLVRAATNPNAAGIRALIDAGADVNAVDAAGRTALSALVCESGCNSRPNPLCEAQVESVRLLLDRGARRIGTSRSGRDIAWCLSNRRTDPYRKDLEALLGDPAVAQMKNPQ